MSCEQLNTLDTLDVLVTITSKLPSKVSKREPEISNFINFIDDETLLASDPLFSC